MIVKLYISTDELIQLLEQTVIRLKAGVYDPTRSVHDLLGERVIYGVHRGSATAQPTALPSGGQQSYIMGWD